MNKRMRISSCYQDGQLIQGADYFPDMQPSDAIKNEEVDRQCSWVLYLESECHSKEQIERTGGLN